MTKNSSQQDKPDVVKDKNVGGRPPKFKSPEHLNSLFVDWRASFADQRKDEIPDIEGFCDYVDAYRDIFSEYEKKPEYSDTIKRIRNWIYFKKKQLAMQNKMNAAIFIFDAKNNAGYVDKQEVDNKSEVTHKFEELNDEQLEAAIKARKDRIA